ncbi:primosomal protein DnaI, partial [Enterococcus faecium]
MEDVGKELKRIISKRKYQEKYAEMIAEVLNDPDVQAFLSAHQEVLTQADIEKSYAKLYVFVQEKRQYQKNDPTMIAPGYEPMLTLNFHYV